MPMPPCVALSLTCQLALVGLRAQEPAPAPTAADTLAAIEREYDRARDDFDKALAAVTDPSERERMFANYPHGDRYAARIAELVHRWPTDPAAAAATEWLIERSYAAGPVIDELLLVLRQHQLANAGLVGVCQSLEYERTAGSMAFLRAVLAESPHAAVRGRACYSLACNLQREAALAQRLRAGDDPELLADLTDERGAEAVAALRRADPAPLAQEAEQRFAEVAERYADLPAYAGTLGQQARGDLFELRNLTIGKVAPDIEGTDVDGVAFHLRDYRGKVVFLDFWGFW